MVQGMVWDFSGDLGRLVLVVCLSRSQEDYVGIHGNIKCSPFKNVYRTSSRGSRALL